MIHIDHPIRSTLLFVGGVLAVIALLSSLRFIGEAHAAPISITVTEGIRS